MCTAAEKVHWPDYYVLNVIVLQFPHHTCLGTAVCTSRQLGRLRGQLLSERGSCVGVEG